MEWARIYVGLIMKAAFQPTSHKLGIVWVLADSRGTARLRRIGGWIQALSCVPWSANDRRGSVGQRIRFGCQNRLQTRAAKQNCKTAASFAKNAHGWLQTEYRGATISFVSRKGLLKHDMGGTLSCLFRKMTICSSIANSPVPRGRK
jgi:hypothetical protein